jgi:hypothetical protein
MGLRQGIRWLGLALISTSACQLWVGEYEADGNDPVDTGALCSLEHELFTVDLELDSDAQKQTLQAYYAAANPDLVAQFNTIVQAAMAPEPTRTATYLTGEAGAGKSFMMRSLVNAFPSEEICDLALPEVLAANSEELPTRRFPDLATLDGTVVLNSLPGFVNPDAVSLPVLLESQGCIVDGRATPLVVLDGLDEIHPDSALALLREVEDFLLAEDDSFVHVVVLGRPEGFAPWFANPARGEETGRVSELLSLKTPLYVTRGDLSFRLREYLDFTMQLEQVESDGDLDNFTDALAGALVRFPFLRYSLSNLAVGNVVIQHATPGSDESEYTVKSKIFEDLVARNVDTHGRPGSGSRYDTAYLRLFERLAASHTDVNAKGEFTVSPRTSLPLVDEHGTVIGEVLETTLLERSGLAYLASPTSTTKRFRFSPLWVHGYLTERFNQRTAPKYEYIGCD